ncbi:MAG TPA: hypothetical protein VK630_14050 [Reyranella sp.]|nr:hypothetical protein [Reyranella sp.]
MSAQDARGPMSMRRRRNGGSSACPGNIAFNFRDDAALNPSRQRRFDMVRDIRSMPRGLIAPLSQAQLGSLRELAEGTLSALPDDHRARLLDLQLIEENSGLLAVTRLGRERLVSDR